MRTRRSFNNRLKLAILACVAGGLLLWLTPNPDQALGSNIAGAALGGLAESFSAVLGFQYLLFVAIGFYLLSAWSPRLQKAGA